MKRKYEGILVLNMHGSEDNLDAVVSNIGKEIESEGATLEQVDRVGSKEYAYENHAKQKHGFYVNYHFEAEPDAVEKVRIKLALNEDIHLQYYRTK